MNPATRITFRREVTWYRWVRRTSNRSSWAETHDLQEVVTLRECGWEGLPPPPVFTTGKPKPTGADRKDPAATLTTISLGLPSGDLETQTPPSESIITTETYTIPTTASPVAPVSLSPSMSVSTLSDFTIANTSDDESLVEPIIIGTSNNKPLIDPTAVVPHETFYLEDGNVEVPCGNTLFRVHVSTLSFHSPALRRMFAQTGLAAAESPNNCPRMLSLDSAKDFATLLNIVYLPEYPTRPNSNGLFR